ncbi:MAG: hypothetical protein WAN11_05985 [Syntrophobacteraceae bacterium]
MTDFIKSNSAAFHYSTVDGGLVHVDIDMRDGKFFILFREAWGAPAVTHSKGYEHIDEANCVAEVLVTQLTGGRGIERETELEAFASHFIGKPVDMDLMEGISRQYPA